MSTVASAAIALTSLAGCWLTLGTLRAQVIVRRDLRDRAESYLIRKRRLERIARSPAGFREAWARELKVLRARHACGLRGRLIGPRDFERLLNAEFVGILPNEISSWTLLERAAEHSADYQKLCARVLAAHGWSIKRVRRHIEQAIAFEVEAGGVGALVYMMKDAADCWTVHRLGQVQQKTSALPVFLLANGDPAARAETLARGNGVVLLHTSHIADVFEIAPRSFGDERTALAA